MFGRRADSTKKSFGGIKGDCACCDQEMIIWGGVKVFSENTGSDDNFQKDRLDSESIIINPAI
jgi:hypothetical protein